MCAPVINLALAVLPFVWFAADSVRQTLQRSHSYLIDMPRPNLISALRRWCLLMNFLEGSAQVCAFMMVCCREREIERVCFGGGVEDGLGLNRC